MSVCVCACLCVCAHARVCEYVSLSFAMHVQFRYVSLVSCVQNPPMLLRSLSKLCNWPGGEKEGGLWDGGQGGWGIIECSLVSGEVEAVTVQSLQAQIYQYADALSSSVPPPLPPLLLTLQATSLPYLLLSLFPSRNGRPPPHFLSFPLLLPTVLINTPSILLHCCGSIISFSLEWSCTIITTYTELELRWAVFYDCHTQSLMDKKYVIKNISGEIEF